VTPGLQRSFAFLAAAAVLAAVVIALLWLGSPAQERLSRLDARRISDLQNLARTINVFWTRHTRLPETLQELIGDPGLDTATTDPQTLEPYEYRRLEGQFELCARFAGEPAEPPGFWAHGAGRACFVMTPDRTKP